MQIVIDIPEDVLKRTVFYREFRDLSDCVTTIKALEKGTSLPKHHGRLIDADRFADRIKEISVNNEYDKLQLRFLTVADVLEAITHDLKGTSLNGFELCPTVIEANKEGDTE